MTSLDIRPSSAALRIAIPSGRFGFVANGVALWGLTLACLLVDLLLLPSAGFSFGDDGLICLNPLIALVLAPVAAFYTFVRYDEAIASATNAFAVLMVVTPILCLFTYIAAALGHGIPLRDAVLAHFDEAIGFHWPAMLLWADAHPALSEVGHLAYASLAPQAAVVVLALTVWGQTERLQVVIYAFIVGAVACGAVSALVPALGSYAFYGVEPSQFAHIGLVTRDGHVADVMALRSGSFAAYSIDAAKGIITFPSFHATLGVLFAWSLWRVGWLRWPALALNVALVAATPLQGSHYVADVLGGFLVASISIPLAGRLHRMVGWLAMRDAASRPFEMVRSS